MPSPPKPTRTRPTFAGLVADAWALLRRDADLLGRIAAAFLFLPAYALTLLVPPAPLPAGSLAAALHDEAWRAAMDRWSADYGLGVVLAYLLIHFGSAAMVALYCDPARSTAGGALARAARLYPRFLLAMLAVSLPAALGLWLLLLPGLYVVARTLPTGPVLFAERPIGAWAAIRRALALTRGHGAALTGAAACAYLLGIFAGQPFLLLDRWMRGQEGGNPVAVAIVDAAAAAAASIAQLALVLLAVVAYRRLAGDGPASPGI